MTWRARLLLAILGLAGFAGATLMPRRAEARAPQDAAAQDTASPDAAKLPMPVAEIIKKFAQHESEFKTERGNYTYTQDVLVEDLAPNRGEYRLVTEVIFTPEGKRYEHDTFAPAPTLQDFSLTSEDKRDLENIQPFVLNTEDLPKYDVQFLKTEKLDDLNTYVFRVSPKRIEKNQRYFQGTVWVDDHDLAVVKSDGKAVPEFKGNVFPRFVTYRENIEGNFWFPTYTRADDILRFPNGDVHIRMTVRYKNYKRFGSTIRITDSKTLDGTPATAQPPAKK